MNELRLEILLAALAAAQVGSVVFLWRSFRGTFRVRRSLAIERAERHGGDQALQASQEDLEARVVRLESLAAGSAAGRRVTAARRNEALAQLRRGAAADVVARTLKLSPSEVALLAAADQLSRRETALRPAGRARRQAA